MTEEQPPLEQPGGQQGDQPASIEALPDSAATQAAARVLGLDSGNGAPLVAVNPPVVPNTKVVAPSPPTQSGPGEEQADVGANTDTNTTERANANLLDALRNPETENVAYGAFMSDQPGVDESGRPLDGAGVPRSEGVTRYAPGGLHDVATIWGKGSRVDLQHSSFLGTVPTDGERARTSEPVLVVVGDEDSRELFAYDNQRLIKVPKDWFDADRRDAAVTAADTPEQHARDAFNLPGGERNPNGGAIEREKRLHERVAATATDGFVEANTWHYTEHELPTELVVGQPFGGDVLGDRRVEGVIVGLRALDASGRSKDADYLSSRQFAQAGSPIDSAAALQRAVEERASRGPENI